MGDLQEIDTGKAPSKQVRVDLLLDVPHQQEAARPDLSEEDDGYVVDAGAAVRRFPGNLAPDRPQDSQRDVIDLQPIAGGDDPMDGRTGLCQTGDPGRVAGPGPHHPGFEDAAHAIAIEKLGQTGDMVLVRVGEDQGVDPPIPGRDVRVERDQEPVRIRAAVDKEATAARPFHEDAVPLTDIEDRNTGERRRARRHHAPDDCDRDDERQARCALGRPPGRG